MARSNSELQVINYAKESSPAMSRRTRRNFSNKTSGIADRLAL